MKLRFLSRILGCVFRSSWDLLQNPAATDFQSQDCSEWSYCSAAHHSPELIIRNRRSSATTVLCFGNLQSCNWLNMPASPYQRPSLSHISFVICTRGRIWKSTFCNDIPSICTTTFNSPPARLANHTLAFGMKLSRASIALILPRRHMSPSDAHGVKNVVRIGYVQDHRGQFGHNLSKQRVIETAT